MKNIEFLQRSLDDKKQGDYINIKGSHNQILNANIFDWLGYNAFWQSDDWVKSGVMVDPTTIKKDDIIITYYGLANDGAEYSFKFGHPNQDDQQQALNKFVEEWNEQNWN